MTQESCGDHLHTVKATCGNRLGIQCHIGRRYGTHFLEPQGEQLPLIKKWLKDDLWAQMGLAGPVVHASRREDCRRNDEFQDHAGACPHAVPLKKLSLVPSILRTSSQKVKKVRRRR